MPELGRTAIVPAELTSASSTSGIEGRRDVDWLRQTRSEQDQRKNREYQEADASSSTRRRAGYDDVLRYLTLKRQELLHDQRTTSDLPIRQIRQEKRQAITSGVGKRIKTFDDLTADRLKQANTDIAWADHAQAHGLHDIGEGFAELAAAHMNEINEFFERDLRSRKNQTEIVSAEPEPSNTSRRGWFNCFKS